MSRTVHCYVTRLNVTSCVMEANKCVEFFRQADYYICLVMYATLLCIAGFDICHT